MFWTYFFNNTTLLVLFYWYNKKLFLQASAKRYGKILLVILIIMKSVINIFNSFQLNLIITLITYFIISKIFFKGTPTKKIVFTSFFVTTSFVSEISAYIFLSSISIQYSLQSTPLLYVFIGNILSGIILFLIVFVITKVNDIKDMIDNRGLGYLISFPMISVIIIYSIIHSNLLQTNPMLCLLISLGIVGFNIIICVGFADIIKSKNIQIENEKLKSQKLHYLLLEEKIDNTKQFIHDFKKHISLLNEYVNNNEFNKLKLYLNELSSETKKDDLFVVTGNQLIDLSLNTYKDILLKHSIEIRYDVKLKNIDPIKEFDFNIVFSNILDNAIESSIRAEGHFIKIKLDKNKNTIILKVINPCSKSNKNLDTLKKDKEFHGYGIKNVKKAAQKYNGLATFEFDKEKRIFISTVIFEIINK